MVVKGLAAQLQSDLNFLLAVNIFGNVLRASGRTFFAWCNLLGLGKIYIINRLDIIQGIEKPLTNQCKGLGGSRQLIV